MNVPSTSYLYNELPELRKSGAERVSLTK